MANIYVKSCSKEGNRVQNGSNEKIYCNESEAQFKNPYFKQAIDLAISAYEAVSKKEISDLEILNITENCAVIGAVFRYGEKKFKLNVFKNGLAEKTPSSRAQIIPLNSKSDEIYMEAEFKGTEVAKLIEKSIELCLRETLG